MKGEPRANGAEPDNTAEAVLREFAPHPYHSLNEAGELCTVNDAWVEMLGYDRDAVEGEPFETFLTAGSADRFRSLFRECKDDGEGVGVEFELRHADGHTVVVSLDGRIEYDDGGEFVRAHCQCYDITERKEREWELERKQRRIRGLFDASPEGIIVHDETGNIIDANDRTIENLGYTREALQSMNVADIEVRVDREELQARWQEMDVDDYWAVEGRHRREDGSTFPVEVWITRVELDEEDHYIALSRDITERKERERELERHERLVENSTDVPTIIDADGEITYVSPTVQRVLGHDPDDLTGKAVYEFIHPGDHETATEALESVRAEPDEPHTVELRFRRADGSWDWIEARMRSLLHDDVLDGILVNTREVTDRKERERELDEQRQKYSTLVEQSQEGVVIVQDKEFKFVNQAMTELTGQERKSLLGQPFYEIMTPEYRELVQQRYEQRVRGESPPQEYDIEIVTDDGEQRHIELEVSQITYQGEPATMATFNDITDRKEREQALERYERLVENLPIGVYQNTAGPEGEFTLLNDAMVEMFDAESKAHLREHAVQDLYVDPDDREIFSDRLAEEGVVKNEELRLETLTGEEMWGAVTAIAREVDNERVFDGAIQDITDRKEYERQLEEQRDNLDVLNQVLRHDIRNDLQLVTAYADLVSDHADESGQGYVETIHEGAEHAVELTRTARDMADVMLRSTEDRQRVCLRDTLERELEEVRSTHTEAVVTVDGAVPAVDILANDMLDSVFRNLLKNAIQHNDKDVPEVVVTATDGPERVTVRVADNGPGIPDDQKEDIFGKGEKGLESEGTGLGLYLVETLVDAYGGDVYVEDNDPEGAVFVVELPRADAAG